MPHLTLRQDEQLVLVRGHLASVNALLAFDGAVLTADADGVVLLRDADGALVSPPLRSAGVLCAAAQPDGSVLLGTMEGLFRVDAHGVAPIDGLGGWIPAVTAGAAVDKRGRLFQVQGGLSESYTFERKQTHLFAVDGGFIARDPVGALTRLRDGAVAWQRTDLDGEQSEAVAVAGALVLGGTSGALRLLDPETGETTATLETEAPVTALCAHGAGFASAHADGAVRTWSAEGDAQDTWRPPVNGVRTLASLDGRLHVAGEDGVIAAQDPSTRWPVVPPGVADFSLSPDRRRGATVHRFTLRTWNLSTLSPEDERTLDEPAGAVALGPEARYVAGFFGELRRLGGPSVTLERRAEALAVQDDGLWALTGDAIQVLDPKSLDRRDTRPASDWEGAGLVVPGGGWFAWLEDGEERAIAFFEGGAPVLQRGLEVDFAEGARPHLRIARHGTLRTVDP
ncbi:MAG: hypothetical protein H6739_01790 [Alphaproteobacteria bacterium]|nr:hypothetical protein [Alphaproteobacteria bacterium]